MARGTTCSSCGGPGHRAPTCGRFVHYKCPDCSKTFTKYPRFGYCDDCFSNGDRTLVVEFEEDYRPPKANSSGFDMQELIAVSTGIAESAVKKYAQELETSYAASIDANKDRLDAALELATRAGIEVNDSLSKFEQITKNYQNDVAKLEQLVNTTRKVQIEIKVNEIKIELDEEFPSPLLPELIQLSQSGIPGCMIKGPAGCGKSYSVEQLYKVLKLNAPNPDEFEFLPMSFTEGLTESDFYGRLMPDGSFIESKFLKCYTGKYGGLMLADELDGADPNLALILNRAVEYDSLYNPRNGVTYHRSSYFFVVACVNTFGRGGDSLYTRNRLDASTLDRFCMVLEADYNKQLEAKLCPDIKLLNAMWAIRDWLVTNNQLEFVSSRKIKIAYQAFNAGLSRHNIVENIIRPWPEAVKQAVRKLDNVIYAVEELGEKDFIVNAS